MACGQQTSGGVYYSSYEYNNAFMIVSGDIAFSCIEVYKNNYGNITTNITNTSNQYEYSFEYEIQLIQNGMIVQSSGVYSCYNIMPQQSQQGANVMSSNIYEPQYVKIVISNLHRTNLVIAN